MMVNFIIKTNAAQVMRNMEKRIQKMQKDGKAATIEIAKYGARHAHNIAPKDTGATARAIGWVRGQTDASATIIFGTGHPERTGKIKSKNGKGKSSLTYYMNYVGDPSHWASSKKSGGQRGNPRFIDATAKVVKDKFGKKMRKVVNAFVNGK